MTHGERAKTSYHHRKLIPDHTFKPSNADQRPSDRCNGCLSIVSIHTSLYRQSQRLSHCPVAVTALSRSEICHTLPCWLCSDDTLGRPTPERQQRCSAIRVARGSTPSRRGAHLVLRRGRDSSVPGRKCLDGGDGRGRVTSGAV